LEFSDALIESTAETSQCTNLYLGAMTLPFLSESGRSLFLFIRNQIKMVK
jgi:hypothetical protein